MKKYFLYELRKNLWTILFLAVICALPYWTNLTSFDMYWIGYDGLKYLYNPMLGFVAVELGLLCYIAPMLVYSFKMNKRSIDAYYALPLKREKLYLVKTLIGLLITLVPFTVSYWGGFLTLLFRPENPYQMIWYVPAYFGFLFFGIMLYGLNAFAFTRGNRIWDGAVFMAAYLCVGALAVGYIEAVSHQFFAAYHQNNFWSFGGLDLFCSNMIALIKGNNPSGLRWSAWTFVYPALTGFGGYALLFALLQKEKGESAQQISDSWFGYKTLIPLFTALLLGISDIRPLNVCMAAVGAVVATVIYQHEIRFSWKYWLVVLCTVVSGIILSELVVWTTPPPINSPSQAWLEILKTL